MCFSFVFHLTLLLSITLYSMGCPFGQLASAVLAESPPSLLLTPNLLAPGGVGETALVLCGWFSAADSVWVCYQYPPSHKCKAQHCEVSYEERQLQTM